jgi:hypothetical protein
VGLLSRASDTSDDQSNNSTNQPSPTRRSGPLGLLLFVALTLAVLFTGYTVALVAAVLAHELRRVRIRWFAIWAATTFVIALLAAGGLSAWGAWLLAEVGNLTPKLLFADPTQPESVTTQAAAFATTSWAHAAACQLIAAAPLAFATAALTTWWRHDSREIRGSIEGPDFSNRRPIGILDRQRITRNRRRVATAHYLPELADITEPDLADLDRQLADLDPNHIPAPPPPVHPAHEPAPTPAAGDTEIAEDASLPFPESDDFAHLLQPTKLHTVGAPVAGNPFSRKPSSTRGDCLESSDDRVTGHPAAADPTRVDFTALDSVPATPDETDMRPHDAAAGPAAPPAAIAPEPDPHAADATALTPQGQPARDVTMTSADVDHAESGHDAAPQASSTDPDDSAPAQPQPRVHSVHGSAPPNSDDAATEVGHLVSRRRPRRAAAPTAPPSVEVPIVRLGARTPTDSEGTR